MSIVSIITVKDNLYSALESLLKPLQPRISLHGKSVLIKPNLVEPQPYTTGQTTNPALVEALIMWCRARGAAKIAIGEGPSYFLPRSALQACFTETGIAAVADREKIPWILFDVGPFRVFKNYSDRTPRIFSLSEHAFSWDHIINVPVPKPHYLTRVSIAMKNLKGFVRREDKPSFHHAGKEQIFGSVTALNLLIRPTLNIVDGTAPVHQNKSFLLAATDIVAIDAVTASLMGLNPQEIRTVMLGHAAGLGEKDLANVEIIGEDLKNFSMNLEQPAQYIKRVFPGLHLQAQKACSGCLIPFFSSLNLLEKEARPLSGDITIVVGKNIHRPVTPRAISIGACAETQGNRGPWLKRCPPSRQEMIAFLKENLP